MKNIISKTSLFIFLGIAVACSYAECISKLDVNTKLFDFTNQEANIAGIPEYKSGIFLEREDKTGLTNDKIKLISAYKKAHMKPDISLKQKQRIIEIENQKRDFLKNNKICVS